MESIEDRKKRLTYHRDYYQRNKVKWQKNRKSDKLGRIRVHHPWSLKNFDEGYVNQGRFVVYFPNHPRADDREYILRSIVAYEAYHGVMVPPGMIVHHEDGDTLNDSKENLKMMTKGEHQEHHLGVPEVERVCETCGKGFTTPKYRMTATDCNRGRFCSRACIRTSGSGEKHPNWKGESAKIESIYSRRSRAKRR
jgi:hypothetical protein